MCCGECGHCSCHEKGHSVLINRSLVVVLVLVVLIRAGVRSNSWGWGPKDLNPVILVATLSIHLGDHSSLYSSSFIASCPLQMCMLLTLDARCNELVLDFLRPSHTDWETRNAVPQVLALYHTQRLSRVHYSTAAKAMLAGSTLALLK